MTQALSIAVIITTYNSPDYLRRVLDAYLHQTRLPDELIVADDGSTQATREIIEAFTKQAPFPVKHVWHEDLGFRAAKIRNEAVKVCQKDYLIFSDGDCIPHSAYVADHESIAQQGYFVQGKRIIVRERVSASFVPSSVIGLVGHCLFRTIKGAHHLVRLPGFTVTTTGLRGIKTCNFAVHRDAVLAINGFNEAFVGWGREDSEFAARLFAFGLKRKDPPFSALVFHLWHPENSRAYLADNDRMLEDAITSKQFRCPCGIEKQ